MGFFDTVLGRTKPVKADLDDLFALPSAALTLQAGLDFTPTGLGSVCFKAAEGAAFARTQADVQELLDSSSAGSAPKVELSKDSFGYTWLLVRHDAADVPGAVVVAHACVDRETRRHAPLVFDVDPGLRPALRDLVGEVG